MTTGVSPLETIFKKQSIATHAHNLSNKDTETSQCLGLEGQPDVLLDMFQVSEKLGLKKQGGSFLRDDS